MKVRRLEEHTYDARDVMTVLKLKGKKIADIQLNKHTNSIILANDEIVITVEK